MCQKKDFNINMYKRPESLIKQWSFTQWAQKSQRQRGITSQFKLLQKDFHLFKKPSNEKKLESEDTQDPDDSFYFRKTWNFRKEQTHTQTWSDANLSRKP